MNARWHKIYMLHRLMVQERKGKMSPFDLDRLMIMMKTYPQDIIDEATRLTEEHFK